MTDVFEGSEKKLEILVREGVSFLSWPEARWREAVESAKAQIRSKIATTKCLAYLLSESSLFIWEDRMAMITCGTTTLVDAALSILKHLKPDDVDALIYERKNEYFPQHQRSDFFQDIERLHKQIPGKAYRMGPIDEHHLYLFHSDKKYKARRSDTTLEILMYDIQGMAKKIFNGGGKTRDEIRLATGVHKILPDFQIDDHAFYPIGYSLNALKGQHYYTVHVTPQDESPYVSFETNLTSRAALHNTIQSVLEVFQPRSFDIVYFDGIKKAEKITINNYQQRTAVVENLACGFTVHHAAFSKPCDAEIQATQIQIR